MSDWLTHSLSEFISIKHGFAFKGEYFKSEETDDFLLTPGNFAVGGGFKADKFKYYDGPVPEDYVLNEGDLVVTMTDLSKQADTLGYSALVPTIDGKSLLHNQRVGLVEFKNDELDKTYLYFLLRSREYRHHVVSGATGTTVKHTSPTKIVSFEFQKPPFEIQVAIGKHLIALEEKIELNRQTNQTLEQIAQAIFKSWFVDFEPVKAKQDWARRMTAKDDVQDAQVSREVGMLGATGGNDENAGAIFVERAAMSAISGKSLDELKQLSPEAQQQLKTTAALFPDALVESELGEVPEGWMPTQIQKVAKTIKGKSYKSIELEESKTALVTLKSFTRGGGYRLNGLKEYTGKYKPEQEVFAGDLVIAYTDVTQAADVIGKPAMVISDSRYEHLVISLDVAVVRPRNDSLKYFLYGLAKTDQFLQHTHSHSTGTTVLHLSKTAVPEYEFAKPSDALIESYKAISQPLFHLINGRIEESKNLERTRDVLLPKLLSGELSPDPATIEDNAAKSPMELSNA